MHARHVIGYSNDGEIATRRNVRNHHGVPRIEADGNEKVIIDLDFSEALLPDEAVVDCILSVNGVYAARHVNPHKVTILAKDFGCAASIGALSVLSSGETRHQRIELVHRGFEPYMHRTSDYGFHYPIREGAPVHLPEHDTRNRASWIDDMINVTTGPTAPQFSKIGDVWDKAEVGGGQTIYDRLPRSDGVLDWIPRFGQADWAETDTTSPGYIRNKPLPVISATAPTTPIEGQTWFDTARKGVYMYASGQWRPIAREGFSSATQPVDPYPGMLWYDTTNDAWLAYTDFTTHQTWVEITG